MSAPLVSQAKTLPAVDSRLVAPGSRYEIEDGRVREVVPADEPHATRHSKLSALLEAHAGDAYEVASDMLTRTSEVDDMAPDASVFPRARHPDTGGRQLEELAFEVTNTDTMSAVASKARKLRARGVRRVFAIDTARQRAYEWSREHDAWRALEVDSSIVDPTLVSPLPVVALVHSAKVDDAMAHALLAKGNAVLGVALSSSRNEGKIEGKIDALVAILTARGLDLGGGVRERLRGERDEGVVDGWLGRVVSVRSALDLFEATPELGPR